MVAEMFILLGGAISIVGSKELVVLDDLEYPLHFWADAGSRLPGFLKFAFHHFKGTMTSWCLQKQGSVLHGQTTTDISAQVVAPISLARATEETGHLGLGRA